MNRLDSENLAQTWPPRDGSRQPCPSCKGSGYEPGTPSIRCFDCFGNGHQGGGKVSVFAKRELALTIACPRCGAEPHSVCKGKRSRFFYPGTSSHIERHRASVALLQDPDSEQSALFTVWAELMARAGVPDGLAHAVRQLNDER